jgi:hypothetical protein
MSRILELNLASNARGVSLVSAAMKEEGNANQVDIVKGMIVVSGHELRLKFEPEKRERVRKFGDPQRALLMLLLHYYGTKRSKCSLTTDDAPVLARSLVGVFRKQLDPRCKRPWLASLVGCGTDDHLGNWFSVQGNTSRDRYCEIKLSKEKWQAISLVVKVNNSPIRVPDTDYAKLAQALEQGRTFAEPKGQVTIDRFEMRIWSGALSCFAHGVHRVRTGDRVQLHLRTNQPVYLYVVWLDGRGQVVTLYPWIGPKWEWAEHAEKVQELKLPSDASKELEHSWRVAGPAGVEHIIVVAKSEKLGRLEVQRFRLMVEGLKRHRHCPRPELMVVSQYERLTVRNAKPVRTIQRVAASLDVKKFQDLLAEPLKGHFDHVLICSFGNDGGG